MLKRFQFVWWWDRFLLPKNLGPWPARSEIRGCVYKWRFVIGPLEIRRWADKVLRRRRCFT